MAGPELFKGGGGRGPLTDRNDGGSSNALMISYIINYFLCNKKGGLDPPMIIFKTIRKNRKYIL